MRKFLLLTVFCCLLSSCGKKTAENEEIPQDTRNCVTTPATPSQVLAGLSYDCTVSAENRSLIEQDINTLNSINITENNYTKIMGITDFSSPSLKKWLQDRTKYILGNNFDDDLLAKTSQNYTTFNPSKIANEIDAETKVVTLMSNIGAAYYLQGKRDSKIYSLPINANYMQIKTPRVGIVQIGEGHFSVNKVANTELNSLANRLLRLTVLFHEARHTDGNGSNVAFPHRTCTTGTYKGNAACEANLNGPYMVELALLTEFYKQCKNCSSTELSTFQTKIADKASRLTDDAGYSDPTPEAIK